MDYDFSGLTKTSSASDSFNFSGLTQATATKPSDKFLEGNPFGPKGVLPNPAMEQFYSGFVSTLTSPLTLVGSGIGLVNKEAGRNVSEFLHVKPEVSGPPEGLVQKFARGTGTLAGIVAPVGLIGRGVKALTGLSKLKNLAWLTKLENPLAQTAAVGAIYGSMESPEKSPGTFEDFSGRLENAGRTAITFATLGLAGMGINRLIKHVPGLKTALENVSPKHAEWVEKAISEGTLGAGLGLTEPASDVQERLINALAGGMAFPAGSALTGGFKGLGKAENLRRYFSRGKMDASLDPELSRYAAWQDLRSPLSGGRNPEQVLIEDSISKRAKLLREAGVEEVKTPRYQTDFDEAEKQFIDEVIGTPARRVQRANVSDDINKILASKEMTSGTEMYQSEPDKITALLKKHVEFDPNKFDQSLKNIYWSLKDGKEKRAFLGKMLTVVTEGKGSATENAKYHWMDKQFTIEELARLVRDNPRIFGERGENLEFWKNGKIDPFRTAMDLPQNLNAMLKATGPSRELDREINGVAESKRRIETASIRDEIKALREFFKPSTTTVGTSQAGVSEAKAEARPSEVKLSIPKKIAGEYQNDILGMLPADVRGSFIKAQGKWLRERVNAVAEGKESFNDVAKEAIYRASELAATSKPAKDAVFTELVSDLKDTIENNKTLPPRIASNQRLADALKELGLEGKIVARSPDKWELALKDGRKIPISAAYMFNAMGQQVREPEAYVEGMVPKIRGLEEGPKRPKRKEKTIAELLDEQKEERLRAIRQERMARESLQEIPSEEAPQEITTKENKRVMGEEGVNLLDEGIKSVADIEQQTDEIRKRDVDNLRDSINQSLLRNDVKLSPEEQKMLNSILDGDLKDEPPEGWQAFMDKLNAAFENRIDVSRQHGWEEYNKGDRFVLRQDMTITDAKGSKRSLKANDVLLVDKAIYDRNSNRYEFHIDDGHDIWTTVEQLDKISDHVKGNIPGMTGAVREMNKEQVPNSARREMERDSNPATRSFRERVTDVVSRPFSYLESLVQWKSIDLTAAQSSAQVEESKIRNSIHQFMDGVKATVRDSRLWIKTSSLIVVDPEKSPLDLDFNYFKWSLAKGISKEDADFVHNFAAVYPDTFKELLYWKGVIDQTHWKHLMNNDADLNVWHEKRVSGYFPFHGTPTEEELGLKWSKGFGSVDAARDWFEKKKEHKTIEEFETELAKYNLVPEYDYANLAARRLADGYKRLAYDQFAKDMRKIKDPSNGIGLMVIPGRDGVSVEDLRSKHSYIEVGKVMRQWNFVQPSGAEQETFMHPSLAKEMMYLYKSSGLTKAKWYQSVKKAQGVEKQFLLWQPFAQTLDNALPTIVVAGFPRWWGIFSKALPKLFTSEKNPLEPIASPEVIQRMMLSGRTRDRELNYQAMDFVTAEANKYFRDKDAKNHLKEIGKWLAMEHAGTNNWVWSFVDLMGDAVWLEMSKKFEKKGYDQKTSDKIASLITNDLMGNLPQRIWSRDTSALMGMLLFAKSYTTAQLRLITGALPLLEKLSPRMFRHEAVNPKMRQEVAKVYQDIVVKQMVGMILATNLVNLALAGHFSFENDEGHKIDIELPWKAASGDKLYYNMPLGRQFEQLVKLLPEFVGKALGVHHETSTYRWFVNKLDPVIKETMQQVINYDPIVNEQISWPGASNIENIMNRMAHSLSASAMPIEFKQGRFKTPGEYILPIVAGGRVSPGKTGLLVKVQEAEQKKRWEQEKLKRSFEGLNPKSPEAQALARRYYKSPSGYINWLNPQMGVMRRAVRAGVSEGD